MDYRDPRRQQMLDDQDKHGEGAEGTYRGIKWRIALTWLQPYSPRNNPLNTRTNSASYWCGYLDLGRPATTADEDCMHEHSNDECTYTLGNVIGFDCAHAHQYPMGPGKNAVYRDFASVQSSLFATIDALIGKTSEKP